MATRNVTIIVRALGAREAARQIDQTGNALQRLSYRSSVASRSLRHMSEQMRSIGGTMTNYLTLPIVGIGVAAVKMNKDFETAMLRLRTQAGVSAKDVATFRKEFMKLGKTGTQTPKQLSEAMFSIASVMTSRRPTAGKTPADMAMEILHASRQLSTVGGSNLTDTASALSAAYVTGIKGTENLNNAAGILNATVGQGNMTMQDLVTVMGTGILPVAKNAGLGLVDIAGAIALLTDEGMAASQAGNLMRTSFHFLTSPSDRGAAAMARIGVTPGQLAADLQGPDGLLTALTHLSDALSGVDTATRNDILGRIFPTGRGTPMYVLLNQLDAYKLKLDAIKRLGTGTELTKAEKLYLESDPGKIAVAWSSIQTSLTQLGGDLLPGVASAFTKIADAVDKVTGAIEKMSPGQKKFLTWALLAVAAIGPLIGVIGGLGILLGGIGQLAGMAGGILGAVLGKFGLRGKGKLGKLGKGVGGLGGFSTGVMNVEANIVNIFGGGGGLPGGKGKPGVPGGGKPRVKGPPGKIGNPGGYGNTKIPPVLANPATLGRWAIPASRAATAAGLGLSASVMGGGILWLALHEGYHDYATKGPGSHGIGSGEGHVPAPGFGGPTSLLNAKGTGTSSAYTDGGIMAPVPGRTFSPTVQTTVKIGEKEVAKATHRASTRKKATR